MYESISTKKDKELESFLVDYNNFKRSLTKLLENNDDIKRRLNGGIIQDRFSKKLYEFNTNLKKFDIAIKQKTNSPKMIKEVTKTPLDDVQNALSMKEAFKQKIPAREAKEKIKSFIVDSILFDIIDNISYNNGMKDLRPFIAEWVDKKCIQEANINGREYSIVKKITDFWNKD